MPERIIGFRFKELPPSAEDAILGAVSLICEMNGVQLPEITFGDPPVPWVPTVEEIQNVILMEEQGHVN